MMEIPAIVLFIHILDFVIELACFLLLCVYQVNVLKYVGLKTCSPLKQPKPTGFCRTTKQKHSLSEHQPGQQDNKKQLLASNQLLLFVSNEA